MFTTYFMSPKFKGILRGNTILFNSPKKGAQLNSSMKYILKRDIHLPEKVSCVCGQSFSCI